MEPESEKELNWQKPLTQTFQERSKIKRIRGSYETKRKIKRKINGN